MYGFAFDNNSKNCSREILKWFLYISRSSPVYSTNNLFDAPNVLRLIIHGLTHKRRSFPIISFFFNIKSVDILSLNSHTSQQHLPAQVHLSPFWNRLPRSLLWNCVNSIVQPLNTISLIQPRWSTWGDPYKRALRHALLSYRVISKFSGWISGALPPLHMFHGVYIDKSTFHYMTFKEVSLHICNKCGALTDSMVRGSSWEANSFSAAQEISRIL